jgi:UDP-N-acetyl-D-galactosamine dehydrogenase
MPASPHIAVVGLGYVGLPVALAFGRYGTVTGFDVNPVRLEELNRGFDRNRGFAAEDFQTAKVEFTDDPARIREADFVIVTVPTPVDAGRRPDLSPLEAASRTVGAHLRRGAIVVFESTVYPGATEEVCIPLLEVTSGLQCGPDFKVGYSPERINPGDESHTFTKIPKVVSGMDAESLEAIAALYGRVVTAGVHRAPSIKVAEAAKVLENTQRDLNIALINELAMILHRVGVDTQDVLAAAGTKWNFLPFQPGLVGGHCLGVDPYYLTHKAAELGYQPEVILSGRRINDGMSAYVAREVAGLIRRQRTENAPVVTVLGLTFKENVTDLRNSKAAELVGHLRAEGFEVQVVDPLAHPEESVREYGIVLTSPEALKPAKAVVVAVAHDAFRKGGWAAASGLLEGGAGVVADLRNLLPRPAPAGVTLWRL